jgi:hypothetical protein
MLLVKEIQMKILGIKIARGRARLQALWNAKGCTDAEVLEAGDELDLLLNKYQRLLEEKKRTRRFVEQRHI